jgi:hypothetical protein
MSTVNYLFLSLFISAAGLLLTMKRFDPRHEKVSILEAIFVLGWTVALLASAIGIYSTRVIN